jgi:hypothetical protein
MADRRLSRQEKREARSSGQQIERGVTVGAISLAVAGVLLGAIFATFGADWRIFAVGVGTFTASAIVGAFVGFLFGLPRDVPNQSPGGLRFLFNSNLLKVSDFVTTTIVGLSLTQVGNVVPGLRDLADSLSEPLGGNPQSGAFAITLVLTGFAGAAILGYLWTTVRLREHLERSEMQLLQALKSNTTFELVMNYIRNEESDINSIRLALAALPRPAVRAIGARIPELTKPDQDMADRHKEVLDAIQAYETGRKKAAQEGTGATPLPS